MNDGRFGEKLRMLREERGYTLRQLAEIVEVHYTHLNKIENGQKRPSTDLVLKIAALFEVTTDQLMKDELEINTSNQESQDIERKIISKFKGFIHSYKLEPSAPDYRRFEPDYGYLGRDFITDDGDLQIFYKVKLAKRIVELIGQYFPGQIDNKHSSRYLLESLTTWIEEGNDPSNQTKLEAAAKEFIIKVEKDIQPRLVYIPVEGLEVHAEKIRLGDCVLFNNDDNSELSQLIEENKKRFQREDADDAEFMKRASAYFTCEIMAHPRKVFERGIDEANLALSILRLYISSYYFDEHGRGIVRRMGLAGTLHLDEQFRVFYIDPSLPIADQYPGTQQKWTIPEKLEINQDFIKYSNENGLDRINQLLQSLDTNRSGDDLARRLLRAITWFAKGTSARRIADSFLMYAIAIEGLLSEDRTPQEIYASQMAALVTNSSVGHSIYPVGGYISTQFATQLKKTETLNDRYNLVRSRILELFNYRNRIAHGAILENEIEDDNLLDFETLVKNAILSFVRGGWNSLGEFKVWINKSVRYDFVPVQRNLNSKGQ